MINIQGKVCFRKCRNHCVIDVEVSEDAKILTYLIIYEPQLRELTWEIEGRDELYSTSGYFAESYYLNEYQYDETDYEFCEDLNTIDIYGQHAGIYMTKDLEKRTIMPNCNGGDNVKLILGNVREGVGSTYVMIAFLDWEQSAIEGEPYKLVKLEKDKIFYFDLTVPEVEEATPYQVFLIQNPFHPFQLGEYSVTSRTIIHPKENGGKK